MESKGRRKEFIGKVVGDKMDKTVVVEVVRLVLHPRYKKVIKKTSKYKSHDKDNECKMGDVVKIVETKPISKDKSSRVVEIIEKGKR